MALRVCTAAMALVSMAHALQLPGSCRSTISAAQRGAVGMALADGVLNVGETTQCTCDAHAHAMHMHMRCHAVCRRCACDAHALHMQA